MRPGQEADAGRKDERDPDGGASASVEAQVATEDTIALGAFDRDQVQLGQPAVDRCPGLASGQRLTRGEAVPILRGDAWATSAALAFRSTEPPALMTFDRKSTA